MDKCLDHRDERCYLQYDPIVTYHRRKGWKEGWMGYRSSSISYQYEYFIQVCEARRHAKRVSDTLIVGKFECELNQPQK